MPEHDAAIQLNLPPIRQEVKRQITNCIRLPFKIKHSVLTPTHKSQKRDKHKLFCWSFSRGHFVLLFLITPTYNCGHQWLCDYRRNSSPSWRQLSTVLLWLTQTATSVDCRTADGGAKPDRSCIGAATQRTPIQWKLGETLTAYALLSDGYCECVSWTLKRSQSVCVLLGTKQVQQS